MNARFEEGLNAMREGRMLIMVDDADRENEGDLVVAAQHVTEVQLAFMARQARGLVCLALDHDLCDRMSLEPMAAVNTAPLGTAFTFSIDAREGVCDGISARDRVTTIRKAMEPGATRADFMSPGHVFPLRAVPGGSLVRAGQTEGSVDLARLVGLLPGAVICEILREDGSMMRTKELLEFGERHHMPMIAVADVIAHRLQTEQLLHEVAQADLPTDFGPFRVHAFQSTLDDRAHLALVLGDVSSGEPTLVRVHRANFPGDTFTFSDGRGRADVESALRKIADEGRGIFLYLNREETGSDLLESLALSSREGDPASVVSRAVRNESRMNFRDFGIGAQILRHLGVNRLRVLTDHPMRLSGLAGFGIEVETYLPLS